MLALFPCLVYRLITRVSRAFGRARDIGDHFKSNTHHLARSKIPSLEYIPIYFHSKTQHERGTPRPVDSTDQSTIDETQRTWRINEYENEDKTAKKPTLPAQIIIILNDPTLAHFPLDTNNPEI